MDQETGRILASEEGLDDGAGPSGHSHAGGGHSLADSASRRSGRSIKRKKFDDELVDSMSTSYPKPFKPPTSEAEAMLMEGVIEGGSDHHFQLSSSSHINHLENGGGSGPYLFTPQDKAAMTKYHGSASTAGTPVTPASASSSTLAAAFASSQPSTSSGLPASSAGGLSTLPVYLAQPNNQRSKNKKLPVCSATPVSAGPPEGLLRYHSIPPTLEANYWKPADDLALLVNVEQTNDLAKVHQGVKFSVKFSLTDLETRWAALLYDAQAKNLSLAAIRQLHPDVVAGVQARALFSDEEEAVLRKVESRSVPKVEDFELLLEEHPTVFLPARTAKLLRKHWVLLRHYQLLEDQTLLPLPRHESVISFSEMERIVEAELEDEARLRGQMHQHQQNQHTSTISIMSSGSAPSASSSQLQLYLPQTSISQSSGGGSGGHSSGESHQQPNPQPPPAANSEAANQEVLASIRKTMLEIRMLENEIPKYQCLLDSFTGIAPSDFDQNTYAVLRGRLVRYLMRSREVTIGRSTKDFVVDVDLSLEGPSSKISRLQAIIRLAPTGEFHLFNAGKRPIFVDGTPLLTEASARVNHSSLLDFSTLKFVFLINQDLVANMRHEELLKV